MKRAQSFIHNSCFDHREQNETDSQHSLTVEDGMARWSAFEGSPQELSKLISRKMTFKAKFFVDSPLTINEHTIYLKKNVLYYEEGSDSQTKPESKLSEVSCGLAGISSLGKGKKAAETPKAENIKLMKLNFQRIERVKTECFQEEYHGLQFYAYNNSTKLLSQNKEDIQALHDLLRPILINTDMMTSYHLQKELGVGGYARVYEVLHNQSGKRFAAKVVKHSVILADPKGVELMKQEIEILRRVDHPNIPGLLEVHEVEECIVLIIELVNGESLLECRANLSMTDILVIVRSLLDAVAYLARLGIVHRDIKPCNIIVCLEKGLINSHSARVIDFGMAAFMDRPPLLERCGTPGYIAPEILKANPKSRVVLRSSIDVYSVGIIFYELIYLRNPFKSVANQLDDKVLIALNSKNEIDFNEYVPEKYQKEYNSECKDLLRSMLVYDWSSRPFASDLLSKSIFKLSVALNAKTNSNHLHSDEMTDKHQEPMANIPRRGQKIRNMTLKKKSGFWNDCSSITEKRRQSFCQGSDPYSQSKLKEHDASSAVFLKLLGDPNNLHQNKEVSPKSLSLSLRKSIRDLESRNTNHQVPSPPHLLLRGMKAEFALHPLEARQAGA